MKEKNIIISLVVSLICIVAIVNIVGVFLDSEQVADVEIKEVNNKITHYITNDSDYYTYTISAYENNIKKDYTCICIYHDKNDAVLNKTTQSFGFYKSGNSISFLKTKTMIDVDYVEIKIIDNKGNEVKSMNYTFDNNPNLINTVDNRK